MSSEQSTLQKAHEHANSAKEYSAKGLLVLAAEEESKAASAFRTCVDQATDEHTKGTLLKLYSHHKALSTEIKRRIDRLREEGKDPNAPQLPTVTKSGSRIVDISGSPQPGLRSRNLDLSSNAFDESFMVLNQQTETNGEESPFDVFWKVTGEIMVNLSQPLSFQTVAMAALDAVESRSSTGRSQDERVLRSTSQALEKDRTLGSTTAPSISLSISDDELDLEDGYDSSDSFCLIPSTSDSTKTVAKLKKENSTLKSRLESMEKQMISVQKQIALRNEQDQQLRDNIVLARKEAQRAMAASTSFAIPSGHSTHNVSGIQLPQPPGGRDRELQLLRRVRELEDEIRVVRVENEKQKAMIAKFRERWERLKESAKRKKSAKHAGHPDSSSVRERIDEDPEAEAAAAAEDAS